MAISKKRKLIFGFLGSTFLIMLSFYNRDMSQEKRESLQEVRVQLLRESCAADREAFSKEKQVIDDLADHELSHLIVDDNHGIIYCYIPKVACTNWKRVMLVLKQNEPYQDPRTISSSLVHHGYELTRLSSFPKPELKARLKHYTKFLFVRDPFTRLVSAYRNKFLKSQEDFYHNYGRDMVRLYGGHPNPPQSVHEAYESNLRPSFYNFIQYLLDPRTEMKKPFNEHWMQMNRLCHPCLIQYDFVGHQETLQEDAEELLKILRLENDIKFPPAYENMTSLESMLDWYGTVPLQARRELYKLYEKDFRLFGYGKPDTLLDE